MFTCPPLRPLCPLRARTFYPSHLTRPPRPRRPLNNFNNVNKRPQVTCNSAPSVFAYPKPEEKKEGTAKAVATAVLSTTARTKAREARKEARKAGTARAPASPHGASSGGGALSRSDSAGSSGSPDGMEPPALERVTSYLSTTSYLSVDEPNKEAEAKTAKKEKEPTSFVMTNPSRLVPAQVSLIALQSGELRYLPVLAGPTSSSSSSSSSAVPSAGRRAVAGIVMLRDLFPDLPEDVVPVTRVALGQEEEAPLPAPFEWNPNE